VKSNILIVWYRSIELDRNNEDCQVISSVISDAPAAVDITNLDSASGLGKKKKKNRRKENTEYSATENHESAYLENMLDFLNLGT
jgi:hypothetical protein